MHKLTEEYKGKLTSYEEFKMKVEALVRELLVQNDIKFHKIESRTKDVDRLEEKIQRKNDKYNHINEITDIIGLRIISYFEDEVDSIAQIIESEFTVDPDNSIDKRKLESDRFGYKSLHYVVTLTDQRQRLTEYKRFKDVKFEIQVRSILQHAWAEIEHDIGYKGEHAIPDIFKRNFYRVAALLETADIEFVNIKRGISKYEGTIGEAIKKHPEDVEINSASLKAYILESKTVREIDKEIAEASNFRFVNDITSNIDTLVEKLIFLQVNTVKELDSAIATHRNAIVKFSKIWLNSSSSGASYVASGISVFYLCYVLVGIINDKEHADYYYMKFVNKRKGVPSRAQAILETYRTIA